ncbi:hypothetical protein BJ138DRAFT_104049 [Hygrophoropsis aurantiaca]|uniref:Uncharacterized protein n=1 Tax=Hygrophoropsis aurantiaca TaxID=72124 RepID=A0ACB8ACM6_9AGAM|nr:hypothetical protein BJ138DRAFT_104049 [Hygrophoropsis aurantiaca]
MLCEELTLSASESPPSRPHLKRPRGSLWNLIQGSTIPPQHIALPRTFNQPDCVSDLTEDEADESQDEGSSTSSILSNSKRRRISRELDGFRTTVGHEDSVTTNRPSILLLSPGLHCDFSQLMSAPSGAQSAPEVITPRNLTSAKHEDWKILKNLAVKAFKQYDACIGTETGTDSCVEALTSMRELLQRCHRFLLVHYDPESAPSFSEIVSPSFPLHGTATSPIDYEPHLPSHRKRHHEPPTAFHAILGMSLFFLGNILAKHPTLSLPDEPTTLTHWFTALDVFALGDNLPAHTDGHYADLNEDWQMAIIWGLALVALAKHSLPTTNADPMSSTSLNLTADDPRWPLDSLFGAIAARRSPFTQRMILCKASTDELMMLAMDQLMRGILHMPRQFTPILDVTERLHSPEKQQYWAKWTTSVLDLMNLDEDEDFWGVNVNMARERCSSLLKRGNVSASEDEDKMQEVESRGPSEDVVSDKAISHLSDATTGCPTSGCTVR